MFKIFCRTITRNLRKNKGFSILNIFGLAIGIACAGLIFLWVEDEVNFDHHQVKRNNLFLVKTNSQVDGGIFTHSSTPGPLAQALQTTTPGVANTCRVTEDGTSLLFSAGDKSVNASGNFAEPSIFSMFTLPFLEGSAASAFKQLHSLVITQKTAIKIFGSAMNVVGKTVRVDNKQDYIVTGLLKDLPENSTIQFEWLAPFQVWYSNNDWAQNWNNFGLNTYVELKPGIDPSSINRQLLNPGYDFTTQKIETSPSTVHVFLFGMNDWHLRNDFENGKETGSGRIQFVHLFTLIAWIILMIACINFMNLATAGSEGRSKEIGVRKVLGAGKNMLVFQFMGETLFMALLAAFAALILIALLLPAFNVMVQKNLPLGLNQPVHISALLALTLICGLVAGMYPSLYLSSFNPVFVLKGIKSKAGSAAWIRKSLVVLQFTVSIVLIIGTLIIYQQVQHVKSRDLGFNKNNLVQIEAQGDLVKNFQAVKQDLLNTGVVMNAALADHETITGGNNTTSIEWPGKDPNSRIVISQRLVSPGFMSTTGMQITAGRDFEATDHIEFGENRRLRDTTRVLHVMVTESMEKLLGKGTAIGKTIQHQTNTGTFHMIVTGVVKDYVYGDMYGQSAPVIFYDIPEAARMIYIRTVATRNPEQVLAKIGAVLKKDNPAYPFEYKFVDDQFNNMFLSEMLISKLSRVFSVLAILISCLGLFGLAAFTAERRTKEIGVRKVLGASVSGVAVLLSGDFLKLVCLSCLVAFPLAWWMMNNWLQNFQYRIEISWWIFLIAGVVALLIALFTISFQAVKAAVANPITSLRSE
jgi:putative ABC transport system permease protein